MGAISKTHFISEISFQNSHNNPPPAANGSVEWTSLDPESSVIPKPYFSSYPVCGLDSVT